MTAIQTETHICCIKLLYQITAIMLELLLTFLKLRKKNYKLILEAQMLNIFDLRTDLLRDRQTDRISRNSRNIYKNSFLFISKFLKR